MPSSLMLVQDTDVTTAAFRVYHESPTQFGREYIAATLENRRRLTLAVGAHRRV